MDPVCIAFKAHMGWVNAVAVDLLADTPRPILAERVDLIDSGSREFLEPYHVAGGWSGLERVPRPEDPAAIIRRGRLEQAASACRRLIEFRDALERNGLHWQRAVMLTSRGWLGDDLEHILGSHAHIHVAEGEAIREATRQAFGAMAMPYVNQDEKSVLDQAGERLAAGQLSGGRVPAGDCDALMKGLRPEACKSWRKEERLIGLGAWLNCGVWRTDPAV